MQTENKGYLKQKIKEISYTNKKLIKQVELDQHDLENYLSLNGQSDRRKVKKLKNTFYYLALLENQQTYLDQYLNKEEG